MLVAQVRCLTRCPLPALQEEVSSLQAALQQAQAAAAATAVHRGDAGSLEPELAASRSECQQLRLEVERLQQREQEVTAAASGSDAAAVELQNRWVACSFG